MPTLGGEQGAERVSVSGVSTNLFTLLGATPALGRTFLAEENAPGQDDVVLLDYRLWQRRAKLNARAVDSISGIRIVKAFAQEPAEIHHFGSRSEELWRATARAEGLHATAFPIKDGRLWRGTWQNIFLVELDGPRTRRVLVEVLGTA